MLLMTHGDLVALQAVAAGRDVETIAVGLVVPSGTTKHIVQTLVEVPEDAYLARTAHHATLRPEVYVDLVNRARAERASVVFAHTHVGATPLEDFSPVDDDAEQVLAAYTNASRPGVLHVSMVITAAGVHARRLGTRERLTVRSVGSSLTLWSPTKISAAVQAAYARQVLAFGPAGQRQLEGLTIAIVGLGGTGSVVAQQLAHLGVCRFILIDPDLVEDTNLHRLVGAVAADVGRPKVDVAADQILAVNPRAAITRICGDVVDDLVAQQLLEADAVMGCTDSMASRAVLNQLAYQHLVPCIDMGVAIRVVNDRVDAVAGRVQMLAPGLHCLVCANLIDSKRARIEFMTPEQRARDAYVQGAHVPQPAVISLNSTVASAAVTMLLSATIGFPSSARWLTYDAMRGIMRLQTCDCSPTCPACSADGALGQGDRARLPTRRPVEGGASDGT